MSFDGSGECGVLSPDERTGCKRPGLWHLSYLPDEPPLCKQHARAWAVSAECDYIWRNKDGVALREVMPLPHTRCPGGAS